MARSTERRDFPAPVAPKMTTILSFRFLGRDCSMRTETGLWLLCRVRRWVKGRRECEEKDGDGDVVVKRSEIVGRKLSSVITMERDKKQKQKQKVCVFFSCTGLVMFCNDAPHYNLSLSLSRSFASMEEVAEN